MIKIIIAILFNLLSSYFNILNSSLNSENTELIVLFISVVLVAPFFETLVSNYIFLTILSKFTKNFMFLIVISSIFFALFHYYSIIYMIYAFFSGLILNYYFLTIKQKKSNYSAILMTTLLHSLYNLTGFIYSEIL
ncbi:type II CAAX prenyl endopeptidase Rce1 family protein [Polaribacter staleyi]|uniref:CPBP family glutamic-type intramembrane protease n=1 Tax=Polaribacter staleyi TaxID=2022337 RepID=UPI003BF520FD